NQRLSRVERPRRILVLDEDWLPDSDVLTPTMKLKRRGILSRYREQIEELYAGGGVEVDAEPKAVASTECSKRCPTGSSRSSRRCAERDGSRTPTSTRPRARSASHCSRPMSRCRR